MTLWRLFVLLCCIALLALTASAQELFDESALLGKEATSELYNVELTLLPAANLTKERGVQVALDWESDKAYTLVTLTLPRITVSAIRDGKALVSKQVDVAVKSGAGCHFTILRRKGWLGLLLNDALVFGSDIVRAPGGSVSIKAGQGWEVLEQRLQPLEPVSFSDDFMREENQFWDVQHGDWFLQSAWNNDPKTAYMHLIDAASAQNPFAYVGRSTDGGAAWSTANAGKPFWENYVMTVAVQPASDGAVGALVNMTDANNGILVRWTPAGDHATLGGKLQLCQLADGKLAVLAESPGGFLPGQWSKLAITSSLQDGVQVAVDDQVRLPFTRTPVRRGSVGLYTESKSGAVFDDVAVYGQAVNTNLLAERRFIRVNQRFQDDREMQAWAKTQSEWQPWPGMTNVWTHRFDYFGDQWMTATATPFGGRAGTLMMTLCGDGQSATSGYRAIVKRTETQGKFSFVIYRDTTELAPATVAETMKSGEEYTFRFLREGNKLRLQCDGQTVLEATDPAPLTGLRPAYRADGCFALAHDILVMSNNVLDYSFNNAPVDWLGEGTWKPTIRWSCAPQWSFLAGWSRGDAVLWHKQRFNGDQTFQAFLGVKMEYPREQHVYEDRYRSLGITICGDGRDPRNGYAVIFGAPDENGAPNRRAVLLRNGVIVASVAQQMPEKTYGHHTWFDMTLQKHGGTIDFQVKYVSKNMWWGGDPGHEVTVKLSYTDPNPLTGGYPAAWTTDNGISIARARIFYSGVPQPRTEPLVPISDPWYPEWANIGKPLTLSFPPLWSTAGKPAQLHVEPSEVPAGEAQSAEVKETQVIFTPQKIGEHWYKIFATEGQQRSPSVHLAIPVFNPGLGRDDSHALVLYRFDEGEGKVVHDRSAVAPAVDLIVPKAPQAHWATGGLDFSGPTPLMSAQSASKLMALKKTNAGTLEFWVSAATNDTPTGSQGCLLSWGETARGTRNLTFYHAWYTPQFIGPGAYFDRAGERWIGPNWTGISDEYQFFLHLQHVVLTWEGNKGHIYIDGKERGGMGNLFGLSNQWSPNAPLLLGNIGDLSQNFLGTYYLVAIHDRCLTPTQVLRHYQAGPSAR